MSDPKTPETLIARADQLAATGAYNHWEEIGAELERAGCEDALSTLAGNPALRQRLNARCALAKQR